MRMMLNVHIPHEPFNTLVRAKKVPEILGRILEEIKPEAVYFTEQNGTRGAILIVDVADPSRIPSLAEPFFLQFEADCEFRVVMSPEELANSGIDAIADKWG